MYKSLVFGDEFFMDITKVVKPFIRRGANTFGNIVYYSTIYYIIVQLSSDK